MFEIQESSHPKLLVVDDSRTMRTIIKRSCVMCGVDPAHIIEAADGLEALEQIDTWDPKLILSDVVMPRLDGLEMMQALSQAERQASVVFITSQATPQVCNELRELGALDIIRKPFQPDALSQILEPFVNPPEPELPEEEDDDLSATAELDVVPITLGFWELPTIDYAIRHVTETVAFTISQFVDVPLPETKVLYSGQARIRRGDEESCLLKVTCDRATIAELTYNIMGDDPGDNDLMLCDSLQELANIVAGELVSGTSPDRWSIDPATYEVHTPGTLELFDYMPYNLDGGTSHLYFTIEGGPHE